MKILFFSHDGKLGDAIVNTAFVDGVLQLEPDAELHALASDVSANFWQMDRRIRKVWLYRNPSLIQAFKTSLSIRRERFDYVVTWKERFRSEKTRLLLKLAAPVHGTLYEEGRQPDGHVPHAIRKCEESLRLIYGSRATRLKLRYRLGIEPDWSPEVTSQWPATGEVILFNMFSAVPRKTLPTDEAAAVLRGLAKVAPQATICLSCTNQTKMNAQRAADAAGVACHLVNTDGNLRGLISFCQRANLIVSTDTALIHIASALEKPLLGLYLNDPAKVAEWSPFGEHCAVVVGPHPDSMHGLPVLEILSKAALLRATSYRGGDQ